MEENKNYTEPEQIEQAEDAKLEEVTSTEEVAIPEEVTPAEPVDVNESKNQTREKAPKIGEKKPMNKKLLIIIGAAVLVIAIVVGAVILFPDIINIGFLPEETSPDATTPEITTPVENPENYPVDADPKQEDIFYN